MRMVLEICRWIDLVVYRCIRSRRHRVTTHPEPKKKSVPPSHRTPCLSCPGTLVCLEAGCITGRQAQQVQTSHRKGIFRAYTHHVYVCPYLEMPMSVYSHFVRIRSVPRRKRLAWHAISIFKRDEFEIQGMTTVL
jgi:hypothetical protein